MAVVSTASALRMAAPVSDATRTGTLLVPSLAMAKMVFEPACVSSIEMYYSRFRASSGSGAKRMGSSAGENVKYAVGAGAPDFGSRHSPLPSPK